ncbi:MAG: hypothetical protein D6820_14810, partial [Lentisphaerae bacterium]
MNRLYAMIFLFIVCLASAITGESLTGKLKYEIHWVGNSFSGSGTHRRGRWMQNMIDEIEVSPEGVVLTASTWDEGGRCTGLYADGDCNRELIGQYNCQGGHKAWGYGTAGKAIALNGNEFFIVNTEGDLLRFRWQ